ncbi:uncharacterized protein PsGEF [Anabrus simplex]|uniref:uncharacterized protein PsGEF n=1 Tax=Anabrus simplex TaxID=316456 RepID=UPI0035A33F1C
MSFAVKHAVKKEITGSFRLLSQSAGRTQHAPAPNAPVMARRSDSSTEEVISVSESDVAPTPVPVMERRKGCPKKKTEKNAAVIEDSSFLRHLELEPCEALPSAKGGRTPFTTTRKLVRHGGSGFGFSVAWTQPPRVERVEAGQPADRAGLRPGDYVIFVEKYNVVTMPEEEILHLIRSCGNTLTLEVYRRSTPNGLVSSSNLAAPANTNTPSPAPPRSSTTCSATTTSLDLSKRRLHLPQVTFSSETEPLNREDARRRSIYQLVNKEQHYALSLQFGVSRFLLPLADRKDLISCGDHQTLFQNVEELLRLTEDILEQLIQEEGEAFGQSLGRIYHKKITLMCNAYRRYFSGLKKADCLLVEKTRSSDFMRLIVEPPVPKRRPDLTAFLHKPLEHYREVLKLLQTILIYTKMTDEDYNSLSRAVQELQMMYRDVMAGAGLMEPEGEGRPLLSLQDLESRLVFTRCKPFKLSSPGRQWIFGGDLSRVEGRAVRPFWALLFTDMLLFAKVSRDRVLFIMEEPLSLMAVTQAFFNIRKKANEFRLLMDGGSEGTDSPAPGGCGPDLPLSRHPKKGARRRTVTLRAPTAELKAVWQNLIQRQIIYLNTIRGGTPASSPLDSPDPPTTLSVGTLDSLSLRRQTPMQENKSLNNSHRHLDDIIEHKCRQLGKSGASKGSALHLAQWMRGQLGGSTGPLTPDDEPELEVWSTEELRRRSEQLQILGVGQLVPTRNESRCEEFEMSDTERSISRSTERSRSQSTSDSQVTVKSGGGDHPVAVCRKCHKTCLSNSAVSPQSPRASDNSNELDEDDTDYNEKWGPLMLMGMTVGLGASTLMDPFSPTEVPLISVLPPTPDTIPRNSAGFQWDDTDTPFMNRKSFSPSSTSPDPDNQHQNVNRSDYLGTFGEEDEDSGAEEEEPPYKSLTSPPGLKRFGTLASLDMLEGDEDLENTGGGETDSEDEGEEWESDADDNVEETRNEETYTNRVIEESFSNIHEEGSEDNWEVHHSSTPDFATGVIEESFSNIPDEDSEDNLEVPESSSPDFTSGVIEESFSNIPEESSEDNLEVSRPSSSHFTSGEIQPQLEVVTQSLRGWTARAGSFVAEKMALFERLGEDSRAAAAFLDRYLRPGETQPEPATTSSDDYETSAATSGEEVWGTPTSGGDLDDEVAFPGAESQQESPSNSMSSPGPGDEETELMMDELLAVPPLPTTVRGFPPRRRLEPLLEEEDTDSTPTSTPIEPQETPSPEQVCVWTCWQGSEAGVVADICPAPAGAGSAKHQPGFFHRLRLCKNRDQSPRVKGKKLLGFLSRRRSEDVGSGRPLFGLFHREAVDDIPTSLPYHLTPRRTHDKQLERRFWKQLRRRRGGGIIPSPA